MEELYPYSFLNFLIITLGLIFCVNWICCAKRIDRKLALPISGALFSVTHGCFIYLIWLCVVYDPGVVIHEFWGYYLSIFEWEPYGWIVYLFTALTAHYIWYVFRRCLELAKARKFNGSSFIHVGSACLCMFSLVYMTFKVMDSAYDGLVKNQLADVEASREVTEKFLKDWLVEDPDSIAAQRLLDAFYNAPFLNFNLEDGRIKKLGEGPIERFGASETSREDDLEWRCQGLR